jgi:hypothetical protein
MAYYKGNTSLPEHWGTIEHTDHAGVVRRTRRWMAYEGADTLDDFRQAWKRTRVWKCGIAHHDAYRIEPTPCSVCGVMITEEVGQDNRPFVEWKRGWADLRVKHYRCAWGQTLNAVVNLSRELA